MAKTKSSKTKSKKPSSAPEKLSPSLAPALLQQSTLLLQHGELAEAQQAAERALRCLSPPHASGPSSQQLPALELLGEIYVELGEPDAAREMFLRAASVDPTGAQPDGADKFLWLAQLNEAGGAESVSWFEKGCAVLRREIAAGEATARSDDELEDVEIKKQKLASALCGAAEVYMTDLSWDADAEAKCEALVTEACVAAPEAPEPLQTLASVRISQHRTEEARSALRSSLETWADLAPEDPDVPDYPTRISLARLLMEVELEQTALDVLERLVAEDDSSVEAWYLGGWCLKLIADKRGGEKDEKVLKSSRDWLLKALRLYRLLEYEDERLKQHAEELVEGMNGRLGPPPPEKGDGPGQVPEDEDDDDDDDDDDDWEDEDGDGAAGSNGVKDANMADG